MLIVTFVVVVVGGGVVVTRVIILYPCHLMCQCLNSMYKGLSYTLYLIHINQFTINFFLHFRNKNVIKSQVNKLTLVDVTESLFEIQGFEYNTVKYLHCMNISLSGHVNVTENGVHILEFMFFLLIILSVTDLRFKSAMDCNFFSRKMKFILYIFLLLLLHCYSKNQVMKQSSMINQHTNFF